MRLAHISSVSLAIVPLGATLYKCIVASQHEIDMAILLLPSPPPPGRHGRRRGFKPAPFYFCDLLYRREVWDQSAPVRGRRQA